jgi:hypothetical protein
MFNLCKITYFLLFSFTFYGCINDKSRKNHKWTSKVCDNLYTETFSTFGQGAFGGDRLSMWLTDSTSFRIYLGVFDEVEGRIEVECKLDTVFVKQFPDALDANEHLSNPDTRSFDISELMKKKNLNEERYNLD